MKEDSVFLKGIKINFKKGGRGIPFLILHGWGSKSDQWNKIAEILIKNNFMVLIPDLPFFGKSDFLKTTWSIDDYCYWLEDFLRTQPEFSQKFYLLGHSFGGALALKYVFNSGYNVKKLFLVAPSCIRKNNFKKRFFKIISKIFKIFSFLPFYSLFRKAFYKFFIKSDYPHTKGVMRETYLKIVKEDLSNILDFISVDTVIIWGEKDNIVPLDYGKFIKEKIKKSKLIIIPNQDHDLERTAPDVLAKEIINNLG